MKRSFQVGCKLENDFLRRELDTRICLEGLFQVEVFESLSDPCKELLGLH